LIIGGTVAVGASIGGFKGKEFYDKQKEKDPIKLPKIKAHNE